METEGRKMKSKLLMAAFTGAVLLFCCGDGCQDLTDKEEIIRKQNDRLGNMQRSNGRLLAALKQATNKAPDVSLVLEDDPKTASTSHVLSTNMSIVVCGSNHFWSVWENPKDYSQLATNWCWKQWRHCTNCNIYDIRNVVPLK
jgi:hypothetical protein